MKKIIILLVIYIINLHALTINSNEVKNANTLLITLDEKNISNPKLTFEKKNIDFFKHPKKEGYYALIPISYYKKRKEYRIIVSYTKNGEKIFEGKTFKVIDGKYKSEIINVAKGKVSLSKKNKKRTKKEYAKAMKVYGTTTPEIKTNGEYIKPLNTKITSSFGKKRVYNGLISSYHSGTDYKAAVGTPIKAVNDGIVAISEDRFYAGNSLVLNHGQGIFSCYFHLSKMNFKVGEKIKKGDIIGLSGSTGRVTGPHLHFAFKVHQVTVDPLQLIQLLNEEEIY